MDIGILLVSVIAVLAALPAALAFILRHAKKAHSSAASEKAEKSALPALAPALLGIFVCLFSLCGLTYAWYTASDASAVQFIRAASFQIDVQCTAADGSVLTPQSAERGRFLLAQGQSYTFRVAPSAASTASRGYCRIAVTAADSAVYSSVSLENGSVYTFTLSAGQDTTISVSACWGENDADTLLPSGSTIEIPPVNDGSVPAESTGTSAADEPSEPVEASASAPSSPVEEPEASENSLPSAADSTPPENSAPDEAEPDESNVPASDEDPNG